MQIKQTNIFLLVLSSFLFVINCQTTGKTIISDSKKNNEPLKHSKTHLLTEYGGACCFNTYTLATQLTTDKQKKTFKILSFNDLMLDDLALNFQELETDTILLRVRVSMEELNDEKTILDIKMSFNDTKGKLLKTFSFQAGENNKGDKLTNFPFSVEYLQNKTYYKMTILKPETQKTIVYP